MAKQKRATAVRRVLVHSVKVNIVVLALDLVILLVYSLLQGVALLALLTGGSLELLLLLEAGILFFAGGAYVITSGVFFGKIREQVFHSEDWSPDEYRHSEVRALPWVVAGVLVLVESLVLALV